MKKQNHSPKRGNLTIPMLKSSDTTQQLKCKHNWHLYEGWTNLDTKGNIILNFVCDKCGNIKEVIKAEELK